MGNISSINFRRSAANAFRHNDRSQISENVFRELSKNNLCSATAVEAERGMRTYFDRVSKAYTTRTGQRMQTTLEKQRWSAVANITEKHTLADCEALGQALAEKYGWKLLQTAIHRDEGHYQKHIHKNADDEYVFEDGTEFKVNQHCHFEFLTLNERGIASFKMRDFGRREMREIQTFVAEFLGMQRGKKYSEIGEKPPKRLDARNYRNKKRADEKEHLQKSLISTLREENRMLRAELQKIKTKRGDYAKLETLKKAVLDVINNGKDDISYNEIMEKIRDMRNVIKSEMENNEMRNIMDGYYESLTR
jgi:putative mobilization protein